MAFTPKFKTPAVFAVVEHGPFSNKKSRRCALTGAKIEYGDPTYMVKFEDYNDAERLYVSEEAARQDEGFRLSVENLEKRMIPAALMFYSDRKRIEIVDPEWLEYQRKASKRRLMRRIMEQPSVKKQQKMLDYYYPMSMDGMSLDAIRAELDKPDPPRRWPRYLLRTLWFLACGFMVILWSQEIWSVKAHPEEYTGLWGGEGPVAGVWYYASESIYFWHMVGLLLWFLAGMLLSLGRGPFRRPRLLVWHAALSVVWLGYNILCAKLGLGR